MKYFLALPLAALTLVASFSPACATPLPFGAASAYNVVALTGNINTQSEILGRAAAAGSVNAVQVGLGTVLNDPYGTANTFSFVANGGYTGQNQVQVGGNAYSPGNTSSQFNFSNGGALLNTTAPINFSSLAGSIDTESLALGALLSTGTVQTGGNPGLVLTGLSPTLNIFNVTAAQLNVVDMNIVAPAGSTIIINVTGGTGSTINVPTLSYNGVQVSGDSAADDDILFNFYQDTTKVNFTGQFSASVLAPLADITGNSQLDGTIIAGSFDDKGEIHNVEFTGNIPLTPGTTPEPSSFVLLATGAAGMLGAIRRRLR